MEFLKLILENIDNIVTAIIIITVVIVMLRNGEKKKLEQIVFSLVTKAEKDNASGTGDLKFSEVADALYKRIPVGLKPFFSAKWIENLINTAVSKAEEDWNKHPGMIDVTSMDNDSIEETVNDAADDVIKN